MHRTSHVSSAISVGDNYHNFTTVLIHAAIARWIRHWTVDHRVVLGESSKSLGD